MKKDKAIEVLNSLITINNERMGGYAVATEETEEHELKTLFAGFISTSKKCKQELVREVNTLGSMKANGTKASGKFFRAWMDVKAALTGNDRNAILNSCEYGEDQAQDIYEKALEDKSEHLSAEQRSMISAQKKLLLADHDRVKAMRDTLVEA